MGRMRSLSTGDPCADAAEATMGTGWNENGRIRTTRPTKAKLEGCLVGGV